jgi:hypothetical protein
MNANAILNHVVTDILTDPSKWTQNAWARNSQGEHVYHADADAICFCSLGAVERAGRNLNASDEAISEAYAAVVRATGALTIAKWNDAPGRTFDDVIDVFKKAAAQ